MGKIFNDRLWFKNNRLLFPYYLIEIFVCVWGGEGQGCDGGGQSGHSLPPPPLGKTLSSVCQLLFVHTQ